MAREHYWFFPPFMVRHTLPNVDRARELTVPLLVLHGSEDAIAPIRMGRAVANAGRGQFVEIRGAGHNDTYGAGGTMYRDTVWHFLRESLR